VVEGVDDRHAVAVEPIAERQRGMVQVLGDDTHAADRQRSLDQIVVADRRREL